MMTQSIMDGTLKICQKHQGVGDCPYCRIKELEAKLKKAIEQDYCSQCGVDMEKGEK